MTQVFISYRRSDATAHAGRVADRLRSHPTAPTLFFDTDAIGPGDPWRKRIDDALATCDVMLVVIGPNWLTVEPGAAQPRLFDPNDVVAYEISAAMARGIRIVPTLVAGAKLPTQLPSQLQKLLESQSFEIRDGAFDRDMRALESGILPPVPSRKGLWAAAAAVVLALAVAHGWMIANPEQIRVVTNATKPPPDQKVDLDLDWQPHPLMQRSVGEPARNLRLALDEPERQNLLLEPPEVPTDPPTHFVYRELKLPAPGSTLVGTVARILSSALKVDGQNVDAINTRVCLKVTKPSAQAGKRLSLTCKEGTGCEVQGGDGIAVPCGTTVKRSWLRLPDLVPNAMAQASATNGPQVADRPAPGDWLIPHVDSLRKRRGTPQAVAFSEVLLTVELPAPAPLADEISYEVKVNGHRLWVDGLPAWTYAVPLVSKEPAKLAFGLENLDSAGADRGRERVEVRIIQLAKKRSVAEDSVTLDFVALRDLEEATTKTTGGLQVRWSASYHPAASDRFQVFAYSGGESDTLRAGRKMEAARVPASATAGALPLVGVVRPPNKDNKAWGLGVGMKQLNSQVRFSFDRDTTRALCTWLSQPDPVRRLAAQGFGDPSRTFLVREIEVENEGTLGNRKVPVTACGTFGAR
jgi:hypothetical protein